MEAEIGSNAEDTNRERRDVTVEVIPPNLMKPKEFTWALTLTIGEAAAQAAAAFEYSGQHLTLAHGGKFFPPTETLKAAHIHDGEKLDLISAGGGV